MEKINYGFVLENHYSDYKWSVQEGKKAYDFSAYVWDADNEISMPSQSLLDQLWHTDKRSTWIWQHITEQRNQLLKESDVYALPDFPHASSQVKQEWLDYRQALRDLTKTAVPTYTEQQTIEGVEWPQKPV
jgi:hypothetical protein